MLLCDVNVNDLLNKNQAAIIRYNGIWHYITYTCTMTAYYTSVMLTVNGDVYVNTEYQSDTQVTIITPENAYLYGLDSE